MNRYLANKESWSSITRRIPEAISFGWYILFILSSTVDASVCPKYCRIKNVVVICKQNSTAERHLNSKVVSANDRIEWRRESGLRNCSNTHASLPEIRPKDWMHDELRNEETGTHKFWSCIKCSINLQGIRTRCRPLQQKVTTITQGVYSNSTFRNSKFREPTKKAPRVIEYQLNVCERMSSWQ